MPNNCLMLDFVPVLFHKIEIAPDAKGYQADLFGRLAESEVIARRTRRRRKRMPLQQQIDERFRDV